MADRKIRLSEPLLGLDLVEGGRAGHDGEHDPTRPEAISWEEFFASRGEDSAGNFLTEILYQLVRILSRCPWEVRELFIRELTDMVLEVADAGEPDA